MYDCVIAVNRSEIRFKKAKNRHFFPFLFGSSIITTNWNKFCKYLHWYIIIIMDGKYNCESCILIIVRMFKLCRCNFLCINWHYLLLLVNAIGIFCQFSQMIDDFKRCWYSSSFSLRDFGTETIITFPVQNQFSRLLTNYFNNCKLDIHAEINLHAKHPSFIKKLFRRVTNTNWTNSQ